jgi:mono/diheme cytochrome c family protein
MHQTTRFISISLLATGLSACGADSDYQPRAGLSAEALYTQACAGCHGDRGEGKFGFLFSIADTALPAEEIVGKIRGGGQMMPAFPQINQEQAAALADYVNRF